MDFLGGLNRQLVWMSFVSLLLCTSCHSLTLDESDMLQQCITNFDPSVDYYQKVLPPDVINQSFVLPIPLDLEEIDTATGFAVNYGNYFKVVEDQFFNLTYVLYQCGAPRPSPLTLGLSTTTVTGTFQLPLANVTIDSTITVAFLEVLGQMSNLSLTPTASEYISSSCVLKYIADGDITVIPDSAVNSAYILFTAAQGVPSSASNAVSFDATYDGGPLKRAEWIKYLATFLNVEDRAEKAFYTVNRTYQCMNGSMSDSSKKPIIAWLQYYDEVWSFSNSTYILQFDSDAGGVNLGADTLSTSFNLSVNSDLASFHELLKQLDVVVDQTYADYPYNYTLENFTANAQLNTSETSIPILLNKRVWRVDKRVGLMAGLDWYESAIPQPHVVLYDLIGILYPSKRWNQTYFRNIAMNEEALNASAMVCNYSFNQERGAVVIKDPEVMKCVEGSTTSSSSPLSINLYRLTTVLTLIVVILCHI